MMGRCDELEDLHPSKMWLFLQAGSWMASFGPESGKGFKGKAWSSEAKVA